MWRVARPRRKPPQAIGQLTTPRNRFESPTLAGVSRTDQVTVAVVGSARGDDEIEYWRMRIGGSIARKSPKGKAADRYSSRRSSGEQRLFAISFSKSFPASARIFARSLSSGVLSAIFEIF